MKIKSFALSMLACLSLYCSAEAKETTLTQADDGRTISLETGDTLHIVLEGNPTTGYTWEIKSMDATHLRSTGQTYTAFSNRCGSNGLFTFTFSLASPGQTELQMVYERPWEKETQPIRTFHIIVEASGST